MADDVQGRHHLVARQQAMTQVFKRFSSVWRTAFAVPRWPEILDTWVDALAGVEPELFDPAARKFLAEAVTTYPPKPWEFAKHARALARRHSVESIVQQPGEIQSTAHLKNVLAIEARSKRAFAALGSWPLVQHVWSVLYQAVADKHPDLADACRRGQVPWDSFDDAIEQVRGGRRAEGGPLNVVHG